MSKHIDLAGAILVNVIALFMLGYALQKDWVGGVLLVIAAAGAVGAMSLTRAAWNAFQNKFSELMGNT
jgi:hypothetical protein